MHYNTAVNRVSVTLPATSTMKGAFELIVLLFSITVSYGDPSMDTKELDSIEAKVSVDAYDVLEDGPDISELSRDRRHVGGKNGSYPVP